MDVPCRVELLGGLRVQQGGPSIPREITRFATYKTGALLAYLAYYPRRMHPREQLLEMLWPDGDPSSGRLSLRVALSSLRHQLEPPGIPAGSVLIADRANVGLNPPALTTDVAEFEAALASAQHEGNPAVRVQLLNRALQLYRGELLPGYYEDWMSGQRERLAQACVAALRNLTAAQEASGDLESALDAALRAVNDDPLCEEARCELMRLYAAAGQPDAALYQYRELERVLREELGDEPSSAAWALAGQLRESAAAAVPVRVPLASSLFGPVAASPAPGLPLTFTRFFGREEELAQVQRMLCSPEVRLLTLTGPSGAGKTRLAVEAARRARDAFGEAVWFVPLAGLMEARLIPDAVQDALRLAHPWAPGFPNVEPLEHVVAALGSQPSLLVLDNLEHVLEEGAPLVQMLLERVPTLTCLATSRRRLDLGVERQFAILPLPLPERVETAPWTPEFLFGFASVQLFTDRAQAVRPDFQVTRQNALAVTELCIRLDGIPLAIELAAARAGVLTPAQMLAQLERRFDLLVSRRRDAPERHRSLRAALDWSFRLLSPDLQRFFCGLCIFRGGWSLEAAETVCREPRALDYLDQLRECSLVLAEEAASIERPAMRFRLLETLREFGWEQLSPGEREALAQRHSDWFLRLAEMAEPRLRGPEPAAWLDRLEREHDNLRSALEWSYGDAVRSERGLRLAGALSWFWQAREHGAEGRRWLEEALQRNENAPASLRAKVLYGSGRIATCQNDLTSARARFEESLALWRELGEEKNVAEALISLGQVVMYQSGPAGARPLFEQSLALWRGSGEKDGIARSLNELGGVAYGEGDIAGARSLFEESLALQRQSGNKEFMGRLLNNLGRIAFAQGDYTPARSLYEESFAIQREAANKAGAAQSVSRIADIALRQGDLAAARSLYEESLALQRVSGSRHGIADALENLGNVAAMRAEYASAHSLYQESLTIRQQLGSNCGEVRSLSLLGRLALEQQNFGEARALREKGLAISRASGNRWDIACTLRDLVEVAAVQNDHVRVRSLREESLALLRELDSKEATAWLLGGLGMAAREEGNYDEACSLHESSLALHRELGVKPDIAESIRNLARATRGRGDCRRAAALYRESLILARDVGDKLFMTMVLEGMGNVFVARGQHPEDARDAARFFGAAEALREALGIPLSPRARAGYEADVTGVRSALDEATFAAAWAEGRAMSLERAVACAQEDDP